MIQGLTTRISVFFQGRFNAWLTRRIPASVEHTLSNKNIFIVPSRFGFSYLFLVLILFLLATNYQNNVIMLLSYFLASLFVSAMMMSFYNLSGLKITAQQKSIGFAKSTMTFPVVVTSAKPTNHHYFDLSFLFDRKGKRSFVKKAKKSKKVITNTSVKIEKLSSTEMLIQVPFYPEKRGRLSPGRLKISSEYCFGLFVTWTRLDFDFQAIVYPTAKVFKGALVNLSVSAVDEDNDNSHNAVKGDDDFYELKNYVEGEPLSRIAWKQLAKGQGKLTKHYQQNIGQPNWLVLDKMPANNIETKLQLLCFLVLEYSKTGQEYGLDLGRVKIPPNSNSSHQKICLTALADHV